MRKLFLAIMAVAAIALVGCKDKNELEVNIDCSLPDNVEAVDLGLPSGIKWANMNVGATKPEEYSAYFAWGETKPKDKYNARHYFDTKDGGLTFIKYYNNGGKTSLDMEDDAAYVNWGADWRMPTKAELEELRTNCNWTWTKNYNDTGIKGYIVSSKTNSNSIFLPAGGFYEESKLTNVENYGFYLSSSLSEKLSSSVYAFSIYSSGMRLGNTGSRFYGQSVRAVYE